MKIKIYDAIGWFMSILLLQVGSLFAFEHDIFMSYFFYLLGFIALIIGTSKDEKHTEP